MKFSFSRLRGQWFASKSEVRNYEQLSKAPYPRRFVFLRGSSQTPVSFKTDKSATLGEPGLDFNFPLPGDISSQLDTAFGKHV